MQLRGQRLVVAAGCAAVLALSACGGDEGAADGQAQEQRIDRERADAARIARQDERIKVLERQQRKKPAATVTTPAAPTRAPASKPVEATDSTATSGSWPSGRSAWTVVLASVSSRSEAENVADRAVSAGLAQAGVLFSSDFSTLNRGYWVAYSGIVDEGTAKSRQAEARGAGFSDAYARYVSP